MALRIEDRMWKQALPGRINVNNDWLDCQANGLMAALSIAPQQDKTRQQDKTAKQAKVG